MENSIKKKNQMPNNPLRICFVFHGDWLHFNREIFKRKRENKASIFRTSEIDTALPDTAGLPEAVWSLAAQLNADVNSGNTADMMTPSVCSAAPPSC